MNAEAPLVTCVCLTRNRREFLPRAIECFLAQTYEPRELLVLNDDKITVHNAVIDHGRALNL